MGRATLSTVEPVRRTRRSKKDLEVVARERAYDAHQLHLAGMAWSQIAEQVGYLDGNIAAMAVNAYLQKCAVEQGADRRRGALQLELDRLDRLQIRFWGLALDGDYHAAEVVLKVIARRCKILGLDSPSDDAVDARTLVVVGGDTGAYVSTLKTLIGSSQAGSK